MAARRHRELKYVWPKENRKHRGFWGRLNNIVTGRGPDIFLQEKQSKMAIPADWWGNWDSYHDLDYFYQEEANRGQKGIAKLFGNSRGFKRYDPHSRRYKTWSTPHDWDHNGTSGYERLNRRLNPFHEPEYPHLTATEAARLRHCGRSITTEEMGKDWGRNGPLRWGTEHDHFWREAHRVGEGYRRWPLLGKYAAPNPAFYAHAEDLNDFINWLRFEI